MLRIVNILSFSTDTREYHQYFCILGLVNRFLRSQILQKWNSNIYSCWWFYPMQQIFKTTIVRKTNWKINLRKLGQSQCDHTSEHNRCPLTFVCKIWQELHALVPGSKIKHKKQKIFGLMQLKTIWLCWHQELKSLKESQTIMHILYWKFTKIQEVILKRFVIHGEDSNGMATIVSLLQFGYHSLSKSANLLQEMMEFSMFLKVNFWRSLFTTQLLWINLVTNITRFHLLQILGKICILH